MSVRKGQIFAPDFVASIVLFSFFLLFFGVIWNGAVKAFIHEPAVTENQNDYAFSLLKTSGKPENWTPDSVVVPGLYSEGRISAEKFYNFFQLDVQEQRKLLRVQDFYMELEYLNESTVSYQGQELRAFSGPEFESAGNFPSNSSVYVEREISVLKENGKRVELQFYSWDN
jgi:hypothetical protein